MKSHSGLWKLRVSWGRDTGYLLTMLVPTRPSEAWFQKRHALLERTGTMLMSTGFLIYLFRTGRKKTWTLSLQILSREDVGDMLWAWTCLIQQLICLILANVIPRRELFVLKRKPAMQCCACLVSAQNTHKSLNRMRRGLIAAIQHIEIPCEMQCVPLKVLLIAPKYLPQFADFKWKIMQLWRQ